MVLGATALKGEAELDKLGGQGFGVFNNVSGIICEIWLQGLLKRNGFSGDDMLKWAALGARENRAIDQDGDVFKGVLRFFER